MNKFLKIGIWPIIFMVSSSFKTPEDRLTQSKKCEIVQIYEVVEPLQTTKVLTKKKELEDVEVLLIPTTLQEGMYHVKLTKMATNLYKVEEKKLYIETRNCFENAIYNQAVIQMDKNFGYTKGFLNF
jgi:hypothetical protein